MNLICYFVLYLDSKFLRLHLPHHTIQYIEASLNQYLYIYNDNKPNVPVIFQKQWVASLADFYHQLSSIRLIELKSRYTKWRSARIPCPFKLAWLNAKRRFNRGIMFAYFLRSFLSILYYQQRALPHLFTIPAHLTHHPLYWTVCTDRVRSFSFIAHNLPFSTRKVCLFSIAFKLFPPVQQ